MHLTAFQPKKAVTEIKSTGRNASQANLILIDKHK